MAYAPTKDQVKALIPTNKQADAWAEAVVSIMPTYGIDTPERAAAFLAQCIHESAQFTLLKENFNYGAPGLRTTFSKYFPNDAIANEYARKPEKIANKVYANRMGNGDEASGDGFRYIGRGIIQLTGKDNQSKFAAAVGKKLEEMAEYLVTPEGAIHSACWFWKVNKLNDLADKKDIVTISKRVNGGTIGLEERKTHYAKVCSLLGVK